jgi:hypothetical protein
MDPQEKLPGENDQISNEIAKQMNDQVVLYNLSAKKAFYFMTPQEARLAMEHINGIRASEVKKEQDQQNYRQFMLQLYEKGVISTTKLLGSFDIDYDAEVEALRFERKMQRQSEEEQAQSLWQEEFDTIKEQLRRILSYLMNDSSDTSTSSEDSKICMSSEKFKRVFDAFVSNAATKKEKKFILSIMEALATWEEPAK